MSDNFCMLCSSITENEFKNMDLSSWTGSEKVDGERIVALKEGNDVYLFNRRRNEKSRFFPEITEELKKFDFDFTIDGEVVAETGLFNDFQQRGNLRNLQEIERRRKTFPLIFKVFDIIKLNGKDLTNIPLSERKEYLKQFKSDRIIPLDFVEGEEIRELWERVKREDKEGIILKEKNSKYQFKRAREWAKLKNFHEEIICVVSYIENPKGIRVETKDKVALQIAGEQHKAVKEKIDKFGECEIVIQYLSKNDKAYRMPTYRGIV